MIRIVYLGHKWYGKEIDNLLEDEKNILEFVEQGNPVVIVDLLETLEQLDIDPKTVTMVLDGKEEE